MATEKPSETIVNKAAIRWNLSKLAPVAETSALWVYRVQREDNSPAALLIRKDGDTDAAAREAELLDWYRGDGAVKCFGVSGQSMLLEWLGEKTLGDAAKDGKDDQATTAIANLVGMLHVPRPSVPKSLVPLREHLTPFFDADVRMWPDTARDLYARSVGIAYSLFDKPQAEIPLHGDVHHDRIVMAERGWVARSPLGLLGDPAYDLAACFLHPWGETRLAADTTRINAMASQFEKRLGYKRKRMLGFAAVQAASSASTELANGGTINWQLAVLPNLLAVYDLA
ncbi:aminoglycoside phosphotransferase family protein [Pelagibacterium montanilacus]|uniref:aminoglycoside phosphotransferase family protein n=1 Tax=Pelagibacterium montanilacus TaxID=2185280 RepID=UPI000F8F039D|nr:aminoglycoside phosphotransferase family protein [Pelagibacterium montanilacus]